MTGGRPAIDPLAVLGHLAPAVIEIVAAHPFDRRTDHPEGTGGVVAARLSSLVGQVATISSVRTTPQYFGGISNTIQFKGFSLSVFLEFKKQNGKNYIYDPIFGRPGRFFSTNFGNQPLAILDRWQKPGDIAEFQKFSQLSSGTAFNAWDIASNAANRGWVDASYIKFRNVELSYKILDSWNKFLKVQSMRIFCNAQNLATITSYEGWDPEMNQIRLPQLRTFNFGLQVGL